VQQLVQQHTRQLAALQLSRVDTLKAIAVTAELSSLRVHVAQLEPRLQCAQRATRRAEELCDRLKVRRETALAGSKSGFGRGKSGDLGPST
jgi:hypothetical protein